MIPEKETLSRLLTAIQSYELDSDERNKPGTYYYCMDTRVCEDFAIAFYPDCENRFTSGIAALEYLFEEGLPIWLVRSRTNYPQDYFTFDKLELLFSDILERS